MLKALLQKITARITREPVPAKEAPEVPPAEEAPAVPSAAQAPPVPPPADDENERKQTVYIPETRRIRVEAASLVESGDLETALICYSRAIELSPGDAALRLHRGNVHFEMGDIAQATADFEDARRLDPRLPSHLFVIFDMIRVLGAQSPVVANISRKRREQRLNSASDRAA